MIFWIILIIAVYIGLMFFGCYLDKRGFNNGICPKCGTPLRHFDNDSQGGQGWKCDHCDYTTWVSWFNPYKKKKQ